MLRRRQTIWSVPQEDITRLCKPLRVLIVEDDAVIAMALEDALLRMGHEVCAVAATEAAAIVAAIRFCPDLMVVDARLKSGSGIGAVQQVRRLGPMRVVFVSGDLPAVLSAMPTATVIRKPFTECDLACAIAWAFEPPTPPDRSPAGEGRAAVLAWRSRVDLPTVRDEHALPAETRGSHLRLVVRNRSGL